MRGRRVAAFPMRVAPADRSDRSHGLRPQFERVILLSLLSIATDIELIPDLRS
jgi:hypothetical protein